MDETGGAWRWIVDKLLGPLLLAVIVATASATATVALTARDNSIAIADVRQDTGELSDRFSEREAEHRSDCAAMQARVFAVESRLGVAETEIHAHNTEAQSWKDRIKDCEQQQRQAKSDPSARPDPFTGTDGDKLEERIRKLESYRSVDEHRMQEIEKRLKQ